MSNTKRQNDNSVNTYRVVNVSKNHEMIMQISRQDESQSLSLNVPVMKMSDYPLEVVIEKKLWFLFPYCIFTYWKDLESKDSERFEKAELSIMDMLGGIRDELHSLNERKLINAYERNMLEKMTAKVAQSLALRSEVVTKGVEELMGGKILSFEAKEIEDRAKGMERKSLVTSIKGLKSGKTPDDLRREGMDEETIQAALECM